MYMYAAASSRIDIVRGTVSPSEAAMADCNRIQQAVS